MKMGIKKYMKKHQIIHIWKEPHHLIIMMFLMPIYIVSYNWDTEYYEKT